MGWGEGGMAAALPAPVASEADLKLREELHEFVSSAPAKRVAKLQKVVAKMNRKQVKTTRRPRVSSCTPRVDVGCSRWVPKDVKMAQHALKLIEEGDIGLRKAPSMAEKFQFKLVTSEIAAQVGSPYKQLKDSRSSRAEASVLVASLVARVVEVAASLCESDGNALIVKQGFREHPGWSATTSRGSGVALNGPGREFFVKAVGIVKARVEALSSD